MQKSLKKQVLNGIVWRGSADVIRQILQIVFTIVLARLLTKGDFGLVAMALIVNRFVKAMTSIGFGTAIIQSQEITKGQISAIFFIQTALNLAITIVVFFCSDLAASFFNEPKLSPIIQILSLIIFLKSFRFPIILLRKKMDFKSFSLAEIISMIIANVIAIIMAFTGFGVWSLVWRLIIQWSLIGLLAFYYGKWLPTRPVFTGIKPLFKFGLNMLGANFVYFFAENMIGLLTGRYLGKDVMGLFNIAFNLAVVPASKIQSVLTSVLTPGFSKLQYQLDKFRTNYYKALRYTSLVFIPFMAMLMATGNHLVLTFYGVKWEAAGELLTILAMVGLLRGLSHILKSAIIAKGESRIIFISTIIELVASLPLMYFLMPKYGIVGLVIGYLVGAMFGWIYTAYHYNKVIEFKYAAFNSIKSALIISVVIFIPVYLFNYFNLNYKTALMFQILLGLTLFLLLAKILEKELFIDLLSKLKKRKLR
ncbi:lipopolysaccharide biosynthesis protein [Ichthyenterobacterium sp. W332]|uniref:Lipopolysaccharide biosynthesis protein n=1 Tax=Microcosmobacter mediterraneus TaxID=3075607 RepID=A0ABU2YMK7_9FLAO|nr:lipopolysaccharide biosynthesis protein [Ichthyenterobacterium sp. W332]MDT0559389.1 lipopolysaccharide biosynthesis protein [Ichthyenterobacterium sp. W332]